MAGEILHNKKHNIESAVDHNGVSGATLDNIIAFDAGGLPKDSGKTSSEIGLNTTHRGEANPHSASAASGANSDITALSGLTGNISDGTDSVTVSSIAGATKGSVTLEVDGSGAAITTGKKAWARMPFDATITGYELTADVSGSVVVDIWKDTFANFPPTVADTITAAAKPTLASAQKVSDATLSGWTTSIGAGDYLKFNIDSATTVTKIMLTLQLDKTGA